MIQKIDSNKFSLTILKVTTFSRIRQVLEDSFAESFPRLYDKMVQAKLSRQELQVCLLILLQFDNSTMAVLMLTNTNVICNVKKRNNEKLFGEASATSLAKNLIESC